MPQIICPNCGMTINLEKRRKIDFYLIKKATEAKPRTFTELLHETKLSRRTLSVRLKELCAKKVLVKKDGKYQLNGNNSFSKGNPLKELPCTLIGGNKREGISLILIGLLLTSAFLGYAVAMLVPKGSEPEPKILGTFKMALYVNNVEDLYAWQVIIKYDSQNLELINVTPGGFLGENFPQCLNETNVDRGIFLGPAIEKNLIIIGGSLIGKDVNVKNGSGKLALLSFGYYTSNYETPRIIIKQGIFETKLLDSSGIEIPINENTLTLTFVR